jgi:hypothetical protein
MTAKRQGKRKSKTQKAKKQTAVMTIPQLRKAFEHVETFVEIHCQKPKTELIHMFQQEWKKTFRKEITTQDAEAYVEHALGEIAAKHPKHRKHSRGAQALAGAPVYGGETRPGVYISPGVDGGSYAQVPAYVDKGFWNPSIGRTYDPVPGQTTYPVYTPATLGSNAVMKGGTRKAGKKGKQGKQGKQGGGSIMSAINHFIGMRPIFTMNPPTNILDDATTMYMAKPAPQGPDPSQSRTPYLSNLTGKDMGLTGVPSGTLIPTSASTGTGKVWFP